MANECDKCDSDHCDVCGVAQKARKEGRKYGTARAEEKENQGPEAAFAESGDNTY